MQVRIAAVMCRRIIFMLSILAAFNCALVAQTGSTSPNPPVPGAAATGSPAPQTAAGEMVVAAPAVATPPAATPATVGLAAPTAATEASPVTPSEGLSGIAKSTITALGSFGLVISLILIAFVLFRKYAPHYMTKRAGDRFLRLIETLPMGEKKSLALVQAGDRKLLLASTAGQITLLTSLPDALAGISQATVEPAGQEIPENPAIAFRNLYELERKSGPSRPATRPTLPPDIRGKMQELRRALEV